ALDCERPLLGSRVMKMPHSIHGMSRLMFLLAHSLHGKQRILGPAIAFFANSALLAPEIAVDRVALRHFVISITLRQVHLAAVRELPKQVQNLPFDIGRRPLCRVVKEDLVLNLQAEEIGTK